MESTNYFQIKFSCFCYGIADRSKIKQEREYSDYFTGFHGRITTEAGTLIGFVSGQVLRASLADQDGLSLFMICDSEGQEEADMASALYNTDDNSFNNNVLEVIPDLDMAYSNDVLFIERLYIFKKFRKKGIAREAVEKTVDYYGTTCCMAIVQPHPIRYSNKIVQRNKTEKIKTNPIQGVRKPSKDAKKQVTEFWGGLGFRKLEEKYMIRQLGPL